MRVTHRRRPLGRLVVPLVLALVASCTASVASPQDHGGADRDDREIDVVPGPDASPAEKPDQAVPDPLVLTTTRGRASGSTIAAGGGDAPYNYAPSLMVERGRYRMWWCSQLGIANPPGDDILLSESTRLDGGFRGPDGKAATPIFSGRPGGFDGMHTCDPSVIRVAGTYFMYYTGAAGDHAHGNAIGLATSPDGRVWTRANGGQPIVGAARDVDNGNTYGAGQPSALYLAGQFYLMFTDTTGAGTGHNGAGQFVLRSPDPNFQRDVQALGPGGFRDVPDTGARLRSIVDAFSADWMWSDSLAAFAVAHETRDGTTITFWDLGFLHQPYDPVLVPGPWREGPGLVRRPDGHAPVSLDDPCGTVPVDLVRATRQGRFGPTELRRFGVDVRGFDACADEGRALLALDGFAMPSPLRTMDLVVDGTLVRIDRRSVAEKLAVRVLDKPIAALVRTEVAAHLEPGVPARRAPGRGVAFLIDDRLWQVRSEEVAGLNSSAVLEVTDQEWDGFQRGPDFLGPPR
ncbi:glycoside hydrolase family protein [Actinophytocola xanthii]|uniref:Beta-xylosidase n=1 Tax=Actinophytocola xanthii TaxID=1912961 RepID=A0A1Q8CYW4_9PSEU|nr:beta-xylosidase [Actinophytocola xanthii]OLF19548.1 beta-xylosidase [Actinophytocola xanthii]